MRALAVASALLLQLVQSVAASSAGAGSSPFGTIEGIIVQADTQLVTLNHEGRLQKVPRALFGESADFRPGTFVRLRMPVIDGSPDDAPDGNAPAVATAGPTTVRAPAAAPR